MRMVVHRTEGEGWKGGKGNGPDEEIPYSWMIKTPTCLSLTWIVLGLAWSFLVYTV